MKVKDIISLLQELPSETEVDLFTQDDNGFLIERIYEINAYRTLESDKVSSVSIEVAYNSEYDKTI